MGVTAQSVTLANSIIGVGILAMPFCFQQCGAILAALMLLLSGMVSRLACYFLLKSAIIARRRNFEFLAFHVFGASGKLLVEIAIIGFLMGTCIAYFVVVGDLGPQIISKMFNINQSNVLRTCVMVLVSLVCVLPLGLLRNVDSLSNVSAATIGFYFCLILKIMQEATSQLFTTDWWNKIELWKPEGVLQCVPIFSMALFCQTQLFEIFETLPSLSLEKMSAVTKNALNICTAVYLLVGSFGYIAFCGQHISGNILMSLSATMGSDVIKLGFVMSLAFSFPLIIFPCRASLYSLLYRKVLPSHHDHIINHSIPESTFKFITVGIITISLFISLMIPNIELVLGLVGSTIGVMICVVFPAACFVNLIVKNTNERLLAKIILCLGLIMMVLGTYANLQAADNQVERYDHIDQDKIDKIVNDFLESNRKNFHSEEALPQPEVKPSDSSRNGVKKEGDTDSIALPPNPVAPDSNPDPIQKPDKEETPVHVKPSQRSKQENQIENEMEGAGDKEAAINVQHKVSNVEKKPIMMENQQIKTANKTSSAAKVAKETEKDVNIIAQNNAKNEDNLKLMKQQQLAETIKKHGEEQKELIKEQKEILDELKKTKLELEKKKVSDTEQANKIAVESIQKIADIAIKSLTGAEEKHGKPESPENLNKPIGDSSVILKNAAENIDKIVHEIKPVQQGHNLEVKQENIEEKLKENNLVPKIEENRNETDTAEKYINSPKIHIHTDDEPKSYVRGENSEKIKNYLKNHPESKLSPSRIDALLNNIPVPLVLNQNLSNQKPDGENPIQSNLAKKDDNSVAREKRETDCDKTEANVRINKNKNYDQLDIIDMKIPQKLSVPEVVNIGNKVLSDIRPALNIMHQSRSLKSVKEES